MRLGQKDKQDTKARCTPVEPVNAVVMPVNIQELRKFLLEFLKETAAAGRL